MSGNFIYMEKYKKQLAHENWKNMIWLFLWENTQYFFFAYFQVRSMCQIPKRIIAKMYILKRKQEVVHTGCTLRIR